MKKIFISTINYNSQPETLDCLDSLNQINQKDIDVEVVVLDNNSKNPLQVDISKFAQLSIHLLISSVNLGFAAGHNKNISYALGHGADYVLILNNDTTVDKNFLQEMLKAFTTHNKVGMVAPKIYFYPGDEYHKDRYSQSQLGQVIWYAGGKIDWKNVLSSHRGVDEVDQGQYEKVISTDFATGACVLISRQVLEKTGGFDEKYFLYLEDSDLSMRVKKLGYAIIYDPAAKIWHKNAKSTGGSGSELQDYFISRNRLLFGMKYASMRSKMALMRESWKLLRTGRKWQRTGIKDYFLRKFGKGSYPVK